MPFKWSDLRPFKGINDYVDTAKANDAKKVAAAAPATPDWRAKNEAAHAKAGNPLNIRKS